MWDFAFSLLVQPIIPLNININSNINPVTHLSESLERANTELYSMGEINRQYCEHQGFFLLDIFPRRSLRLKEDQLKAEHN